MINDRYVIGRVQKIGLRLLVAAALDLTLLECASAM